MASNFKRTFGNLTSPVPLSYLDDNFSQLESSGTSTVTLAGAQLVGFMQSGSGATAETVQVALRKIKFSDSYSTLQEAADAAAGGILVVRGTNTISAAVTLDSNTEVLFDPGALVQSAATSISLFKATSKTNIRISRGHFKYTAAGSTGLIGGVELQSCTNCYIEDSQFEGMQFSGVFLQNSDDCVIRGNDFYSTLGTHADANDICIYDNSDHNLVEGNWCFGDGAHGILRQSTTGTLGYKNQIKNNYVDGKTTYGIVDYQVTADDSETTISGNHVWDITGAGLSGASGSGIYCQTAGGATIVDNYIHNCCTSTTSTSNAPAGISVAFNGSVRKTVTVRGNHIEQPKYWGISLSDAASETICSDNEITFADGTNGFGIRAIDVSNTSIVHNRVQAAITVERPGINVATSAGDCVGNDVSHNTVTGTNGNLINFAYNSTNRHKKCRVIGNTCTSTGASAQGVVCFGLSNSTISLNTIECPSVGLYVDTVVGCRGSGNVVTPGTTNAFLSAGTCTTTFFDDSNHFGTNMALVQNQAAGVNLHLRLAGVPAGGNWQVGDEWTTNAPAAATSPGGMCTAAGSPGTWKARAALAA